MFSFFASQCSLREYWGLIYSVLYMEKSQTSLDIKNPGLRTLLPEVERYFVRGGGLSVLEVLPA